MIAGQRRCSNEKRDLCTSCERVSAHYKRKKREKMKNKKGLQRRDPRNHGWLSMDRASPSFVSGGGDVRIRPLSSPVSASSTSVALPFPLSSSRTAGSPPSLPPTGQLSIALLISPTMLSILPCHSSNVLKRNSIPLRVKSSTSDATGSFDNSFVADDGANSGADGIVAGCAGNPAIVLVTGTTRGGGIDAKSAG